PMPRSLYAQEPLYQGANAQKPIPRRQSPETNAQEHICPGANAQKPMPRSQYTEASVQEPVHRS
ncbi:hypothetical protein LSAT2_011920, partial [Lamellibrachia satsuma]